MRKLFTLYVLCLSTVAAQAADNGFYVGAGAGVTDVTSAVVGDNTGNNPGGYKLIAGFRLLDSLAFEVNYLDFGKVSLAYDSDCSGAPPCALYTVPVAATAFSGYAVGSLSFPLLDAFAKLGVARVEGKTSPGDAGSFGTEKKTDVAWGAGVQVHFGSFSVRGEFEQFQLRSSSNLKLLSINLLYTFL